MNQNLIQINKPNLRTNLLKFQSRIFQRSTTAVLLNHLRTLSLTWSPLFFTEVSWTRATRDRDVKRSQRKKEKKLLNIWHFFFQNYARLLTECPHRSIDTISVQQKQPQCHAEQRWKHLLNDEWTSDINIRREEAINAVYTGGGNRCDAFLNSCFFLRQGNFSEIYRARNASPIYAAAAQLGTAGDQELVEANGRISVDRHDWRCSMALHHCQLDAINSVSQKSNQQAQHGKCLFVLITKMLTWMNVRGCAAFEMSVSSQICWPIFWPFFS